MKKNETETEDLVRLGCTNVDSLIQKTIHIPVGGGYVVRCYCRNCLLSYDTTLRGVQMLRERIPEQNITLPKGITDLQDKEQLKNCYIIMDLCHMCKTVGEETKLEVKLISDHQPTNGKNNWQNSLNNRNRNNNDLEWS